MYILEVITTSLAAGCPGAFADFRIVCSGKVAFNAQYIIPELSFTYDGTVTQWKVGIEVGGDRKPQSVNLQIWRSVGAGQYTSVTEVVYNKTADKRIAFVPASMSVIAGDMVAWVYTMFLKNSLTLYVDLTMYTTGGSPASSLSSLGFVVVPSLYISVVFGECFLEGC